MLAALAPASITYADNSNVTYDYLISSGFLCGIEPSECPAVAAADNGDKIYLSGEGDLSIHAKSASGSGTFTHKNAAGDVLASGTWEATKLLSFKSYGSASAQGLPPAWEGGKAQILVNIIVGGVVVHTGILTVECVLGDKIPAGATEGVRLNVKDAINFNKDMGAIDLFINTT